jgi:thiamine biosynthesis lipoprotein
MRHVLVPLAVGDTLPPAGSKVVDLSGTSMGTTWSARVAIDGKAGQMPGMQQDLADGLQQELDTVVAQMSHWVDDSNLARFNAGDAGSWHALPNHLFEVVRYAMWVAHISGGAYDPFAGALVNRWGFGARARFDEAGFAAPSDADVATLLVHGKVELDVAGRRLLQPGGATMDLSSIAKGFAVDLLGRYVSSKGFDHYLVEVGGELRGAGLKPDGQPWWVELEAVPDAPQTGQTVIALHGMAVATSGDYRRFYAYSGEHGARHASHTLDPRSGYPITHGIASVSVVHASCMAADALSTALTVLGLDDGMRLARQQQLAARFVRRGPGGALEQCHSPAWQELLS